MLTMVLNYIWISFFLIAFVIALVRLIFLGDIEIFPALMANTYETAKMAFELAYGRTASDQEFAEALEYTASFSQGREIPVAAWTIS